jgi:outer membrane protein insertion porin family
MRIDRQLLLLGVLLGSGVTTLAGQDPLTTITPSTEVRSIKFDFEGTRTLEELDLRTQLATTARGRLDKVIKLLSWLPAVPAVLPHPFEPLALQRDVARLRQFYRRNGFPKATVHYVVRYQAKPNVVDITFVVREGPPLLLATLDFQGSDTTGPVIPAELESEWARYVEWQRTRIERWTEDQQRGLADSTTRWFRDRGYPFAMATTRLTVDSAALRAAVNVVVAPGQRHRLGRITVVGNRAVAARYLRRQLPVDTGEWYNASQLEQGRQQLMQFDVIRLALIQVRRDSRAPDSVVDVALQVSENEPHLIRTELGLSSGSGIGGQADWTHRNFFGGLRTLTIGIGAATGVLPLESAARQEYRLAVSMFEPYVGDRRISLGVGPFAEYRNDVRDRSWRVGMQGSLVFATSPLRSVALGYTVARRRILDFGFGNIEPSQYLPLLGLATLDQVGELRETLDHSVLTLGASWGRLDRFANPRKGFVLRPKLELTTPFLNTVQYALVEVGASAFLPLRGAIGATLRASAGRIYPFGRSLPGANQSPIAALLNLHEATFTAGGTRDVRGWGSDLLGPKLPKVEPRIIDSTLGFAAEQYAPVGGLARVLGSAQLNVPLPVFGGKLHSFAFLDGARVWTPDARFAIADPLLAQDPFFFGTGGGVGYETLVGAIEVAVGYKLNPSALDLRDPGAVMSALSSGGAITDVPSDARRRWQLHFSIGASF